MIRTALSRLRAWAVTSHAAAQAGRFVRLTVVALAATGIVQASLATQTVPTRATAMAALVGAVEVAYRQMFKVAPKEAVEDVAGALVSGDGFDVSTIITDPETPVVEAPAPDPMADLATDPAIPDALVSEDAASA